MSKSINVIQLLGYVGRDPEVRDVGGTQCASFSMATGDKYTSRDGREVDNTQWHRVEAWDSDKGQPLAKVVSQYVRKGDRVYVTGEVRYRKYADKDGIERTATTVNARDIVLLSSKSDSEQPARIAVQDTRTPAQRRHAKTNGYEERQPLRRPEPQPTKFDDDDLPF